MLQLSAIPNMHPMFHIPSIIGVIPFMSAAATWMMNREMAKLDFPPVGEFVQTLVDSGAHLYGCKMSVGYDEVENWKI